MLITKEIGIDMGHRVPNHKSKCKSFHGHFYLVRVGVDDKVITETGASSEGMVIDFSDLKDIMMSEIDSPLDHGTMVYEQDKYLPYYRQMKQDGLKVIIVPFIPTVENIAKYLFIRLRSKLQTVDIKIKFIKVWETRTSTATYTETDFEKDISLAPVKSEVL